MKVVPMHAPTQAPDEPLTAGAPFGPGPGPRMQPRDRLDPGPPAPRDEVAEAIRGAYAAYPSSHMATLMDYLEAQGR